MPRVGSIRCSGGQDAITKLSESFNDHFDKLFCGLLLKIIGRSDRDQQSVQSPSPCPWWQPPPPRPVTVTTKHLAYALAEQHQLSKKQSLETMEELVGMITKHLKKGERVKIVGLGILQVRNRAARMGRNPATGEAIQIKASKKVAFRATKELKMVT